MTISGFDLALRPLDIISSRRGSKSIHQPRSASTGQKTRQRLELHYHLGGPLVGGPNPVAPPATPAAAGEPSHNSCHSRVCLRVCGVVATMMAFRIVRNAIVAATDHSSSSDHGPTTDDGDDGHELRQSMDLSILDSFVSRRRRFMAGQHKNDKNARTSSSSSP
jgi:hypothetical protein